MRTTSYLSMLAAATLAMPAAADTSSSLYDSFNGTPAANAGSGFSYGWVAGASDGFRDASGAGAPTGLLFNGVLTAFTGDCSRANVQCINVAGNAPPAIARTTVPGGNYTEGTGIFRPGQLNFHPGPAAANGGIGEAAGFQFTVGETGTTSWSIDLSRNDSTNAWSIQYALYEGTTLLTTDTLGGSFGSTTLTGSASAAAGTVYTFLIGPNQDFRYDSTGLAATFSTTAAVTPGTPGAVPEPATWAMMIAGFGLAGGALRTRRRHPAIA